MTTTKNKSIPWIVAFSALLVFTSVGMAADGSGSHGGDTVTCEKSESSTFAGYWNLDYLLTYTAQNNNGDVAPVQNWQQSSIRILKILDAKIPSAAASFRAFAADVMNTTDYAKTHIWEEGSFGLVLIKKSDETYQYIDRYLPKNCYAANGQGEINLIRTVTRTQKDRATFYAFDSQIIKDLSPLQLSFLYVHEWLRDYTNDERIIRRVNRLLHSNVIEDPTYNLRLSFDNIGLELTKAQIGFVPICDRTSEIRDWFEKRLSRNCKEITGRESLDAINVLDLSTSGLESLKAGDLSGFETLANINLKQNGISDLPVGVFYQLVSKQDGKRTIDLSENLLSRLEERAFYGMNLSGLSLKKNHLVKFDDGAFSSLKLNYLDLSNNELQSINANAFKNVHVGESYGSIDFSFNNIRQLSPNNFAGLSQSYFTRLELHNNLITQIDDSAFGGLRFEYLTLDHNQISTIGPNAFQQVRDLKKIDLSYNRLAALPDRVFAGLNKSN